MKPIIKWLGGKTQCLNYIKELMPSTYNKYYEPFLGGGAVLLDLCPKEAIVNDINPELINMYNQIKYNREKVIWELDAIDDKHECFVDPKQFYYAVRENFNLWRGSNTPEQAARFIYLNKHCFNGLYRVNSKGEFNVPFNGKLSGMSYDKMSHLVDVSKQLQNVELKCGDFEDTLKEATTRDFCFIDSPYAPLTPTSFVDYTKEGFAYEDHLRLARVFNELTARGVYCMLTNHDTELIRELYSRYHITEVDVRRSINRDGSNRKGKEVIITNYARL